MFILLTVREAYSFTGSMADYASNESFWHGRAGTQSVIVDCSSKVTSHKAPVILEEKKTKFKINIVGQYSQIKETLC